jgi:hypothetical protein
LATETTFSAPQALIQSAIDDAARRVGVARASIEVLSAESVTWSDGSLGCPEPGMLYTQALVPGYRVVLRAGTTQLHYHSGRSGTPAYCPPERAMEPAPPRSLR